jgi:hypothetical protein
VDLLLSGLFLTVLLGCSSWQKNHDVAVTQFGSADLQKSQEALEKSQKALRAEKNLLELDQAVLDLASGNVAQAETRFRTLRRELEHLEQKALTERAQSILTDSRAVAFSGRDFERRMIVNMALLTSVLNGGQDSFAYSLQVVDASAKRRDAIAAATKEAAAETGVARLDSPGQVLPVGHTSARDTNPVATTLDQPLALSAYLAAAVQSEFPTRAQETDQALADLDFWNASFHQQSQSATPAEFGTRCKPGHGTLHVISLVGKAPRWVSESAVPTSAALLIADQIISATGKHTLPPTIASVKISRPEISGNVLPPGFLKCAATPATASSGESVSLQFSTVVNLNDVATASYQEHRDEEIAAAIARRVTKKGAVYVLKETQKVHRNSLVDLGINVAGVAWEALEKADTRSWRMLPARIDVASVELPEGEWKTQLQIPGASFPGGAQTVPVWIENGRNTFVVCMIPEQRLTGHVLVGGADQKVIPVHR